MVMMLELSPSISFAPKVIKLRLEYWEKKKWWYFVTGVVYGRRVEPLLSEIFTAAVPETVDPGGVAEFLELTMAADPNAPQM